jgi:acyl-coenzyme A synthetase/AMP-(fatty) acid ligase/acyl carrier protein
VFALFTTLGVDLTVTSLFTPLFVGGRIRIYPEHDPGIPDIRVLDVFADDRCDVVKLTPSHLNLIRDKGLASATIRSLIVGGEQLSTTLVEAMRTNLPPDVHIFNEYGPTEATVGCIVSVYRPEYALRGAVPIGRPIANTEAWILNEAGAAVPDGAPGEIYLGGTSLAKEYRFRPELTRERFVDHPFRVGGRLYRTGDRGRRNAEGDIEFLGRTDRQLKVRGFRIELAGIEGILMTHPRITGAVVDAVAGEDGSGSDLRLVAYYQSPAPLGNEELRTHLRKHLPHYSLPRVFVHMDTFPLTRSGKLDRTALPARNEPAPVEPYRYAAPEGEIEELLAEIWREVFGRERIGVHDAFLDVGGHSLTAIRLAARITATFDLEMPLHLVFTYPTIAQQASYLTDKLTQLLDLRDEAEKPN